MSIAEETPFAVALELERDRITVRLTGELDLSTRPELTLALDEAVSAGPRAIVVDLRGLSFIDSTGIVALLAAVDAGRRNDCAVSFLRTDGTVERTLRIAGVQALMPLAA
jgi:anti-sigma B factor antagonist